MRTYLFLIIALFLATAGSGQFKAKGHDNVKGYYIKTGNDTIWGNVTIPILAEQLDLASLSNKFTFVDSNNKSKQFRPKDVVAFGIIHDEITSDFVSSKTDDGQFFLKRLVDGPVALFEERKGHAEYLSSYNQATRVWTTSNKPYNYSTSRSAYFFGKPGEMLEKMHIDHDNSFVSGKDLEKIRALIPDIKIPDTGITISGLAELLRTYYNRTN